MKTDEELRAQLKHCQRCPEPDHNAEAIILQWLLDTGPGREDTARIVAETLCWALDMEPPARKPSARSVYDAFASHINQVRRNTRAAMRAKTRRERDNILEGIMELTKPTPGLSTTLHPPAPPEEEEPETIQ